VYESVSSVDGTSCRETILDSASSSRMRLLAFSRPEGLLDDILNEQHLWQVSPHYIRDHKRLHDDTSRHFLRSRIKENYVKNLFCAESRLTLKLFTQLFSFMYLREYFLICLIYISLSLDLNYSWIVSTENIFFKFWIIFLLIFLNLSR